jgi:hypothetical protein
LAFEYSTPRLVVSPLRNTNGNLGGKPTAFLPFPLPVAFKHYCLHTLHTASHSVQPDRSRQCQRKSRRLRSVIRCVGCVIGSQNQMDQSEDNTQEKVRLHEATNLLAFLDSRLYDIDYLLWKHQKDLLNVRGAVQKMRNTLPASVGACLCGDNDLVCRAHTNCTPEHGRAHTQVPDFAESSESNGFVSELMAASNGSPNETTARVTEDERSTASDTNAPAPGVGESGVAGCVARIQQLQSTGLVGSAKRAGLAKWGSEKQRIGLRRSPRRHRQT